MTPRTVCQRCQSALPIEGDAGFACRHGCTYCHDCAGGELEGLCPTCGGALGPRPPYVAVSGPTR